MDKIVGIVGLAAILVLVGWGVPPRYRLIAIAGGLASGPRPGARADPNRRDDADVQFSARPRYSRCRLGLDSVFVCEKLDGGERP